MAFSWQRSRSTENAICSICLEEKRNRRRLPCLHSFCLRCLERHCENKSPGSNVLCPLCRTTFQIPQNGLDDWEDPIDDRDGEKTCEVCSTVEDIKPANVYCVDCTQLLCERCSLPHKKMRGGPHSVIQLAELHAQRRNAEEFAPETSRGPAVACREAFLHVESQRKEFLESVKNVKQQVKERGEAVMRVVDGHVKELLAEIDEIERDAVKEANTLTETLKMALSPTFGPEVSSTIPRSELITTCIEATCYEAPHVAFTPRDIDELIGDEKNTVGSVLKNINLGKWVISDSFYSIHCIPIETRPKIRLNKKHNSTET